MIYQNKSNGQLVDLISYHDADYAMVRTSNGSVNFVLLADLVSYEPGKGRTGEAPPKPVIAGKSDDDEESVPVSPIPVDTRLNLNTATAEMIAERIKGVGYSTAKKIVELKVSLPGEKFTTLDQLHRIGRVDWDQVIADDLIFVA